VIPYSGYSEYSLETVYNYQYEVPLNSSLFNDGNTYEYRIEKNSDACTLADNSLASGILHQYPAKGTALDESLDIWVLGDPGASGLTNVRNAYNNYKGNNYEDDFIMLLGDNAYRATESSTNGAITEDNTTCLNPSWCISDGSDYAYSRAIFAENKLQEPIKDQIMWTTIGNHEVDYYFNKQATGEENIEEFFRMYSYMERDKGYYSYDYGEAHFICLNSEIRDDLFSDDMTDMKNWLMDDLNNNDSKWTIVYFHHPVHTGTQRSDRNTLNQPVGELDARKMIDEILPILYQYKVDLVFSGHTHLYERSFLVHEQNDVNVNSYCDGEGNERPASIVHDGSPTNDYLDDYVNDVYGYDCDNFDESIFPKSDEGTVFVVLGSSSKTSSLNCSYEECYLDHPIMRPMKNPETKYISNCSHTGNDRGRGLYQKGSGHLSIQGDQLTFEFVAQVSNSAGFEVMDRFTIDKSDPNAICNTEANFTYDHSNDPTIDFTSTSTGADSYFWEFGDGTTSTQENPTHTYAANGSYTIYLTITNDDCTESDMYGAAINIDDIVNACNVTASFTYDDSNSPEIIFTSTSTDAELYFWDFNDGSNSTSQTENPTHTFSMSGSYIIELRVYNSACNDFDDYQITIVIDNEVCEETRTYYPNEDMPEETHTSDWIKLKGHTIEGNQTVTLKAGEYIELLPREFDTNYPATIIEYGANFEAYIEACPGIGKKESVEKVTETKLKVYPNPFSDIFNIEYNTNKETAVTIAIYNLSGQLEKVVKDQEIHPIGSHNIEVDAQSLREGVYIVQILTEDSQLTQKLVKL